MATGSTSRIKKKRSIATFIANEKERAVENCIARCDQAGFVAKKIDDYIGFGVFTRKTFKKGHFLLEYRGDLVPFKEGKRREILYEGTGAGCFIYFFKHKDKLWCLDATNNIFDMGRLVNDAKQGDEEENVSLQIIEVNGRPHLCMFALRDLREGEELRYDYGQPDRCLPWRKQSTSKECKENKEQERKGTVTGRGTTKDKEKRSKRKFQKKEIDSNGRESTLKVNKQVEKQGLKGILQEQSSETETTDKGVKKGEKRKLQKDENISTLSKDEQSTPKIRKQGEDSLHGEEDVAVLGPELGYGKASKEKEKTDEKGAKRSLPMDAQVQESTKMHKQNEKKKGVKVQKEDMFLDSVDEEKEKVMRVFEKKTKSLENEETGHIKKTERKLRPLANRLEVRLNIESEGNNLGSSELSVIEASSESWKVSDGEDSDSDMSANVPLAEISSLYTNSTTSQTPWLSSLGSLRPNPNPCNTFLSVSNASKSTNYASPLASHTSPPDTHTSTSANHTSTSARDTCPSSSHTSTSASHTSPPASPTSQSASHNSTSASHISPPPSHSSQPASHTSSSAIHTSPPATHTSQTSTSASKTFSSDSNASATGSNPAPLPSDVSPSLQDENDATSEGSTPAISLSEEASNSQKSLNRNESVTALIVPTTSGSSRRSDDKRYHCLHCGKAFAKLERHLRSKHKTEDDVHEMVKQSDPKERKKMYQRLRNIGNYMYNCDVIRKGEGELSVRYRPSDSGVNNEDYGPCPYCFAFLLRKDLWRHKCPYKPETEKRVSAASRLLTPATPETSHNLKTVLSNMISDTIARVAKSDDIIREFGEKLCKKHGHDKERHNYIRQKLREMSRLLIALRENGHSPNKSLQEFLKPNCFNLIVEACKRVTVFDERTNNVNVPSLALKIGPSLVKCVNILMGHAIQRNDKNTRKECKEFLALYELNWSDDVTTNAHRTIHEKKINKPKLIPLASDIKLFNSTVKAVAKTAYQALLNEKDEEKVKSNWVELAKALLVLLIFFNRRRVGGVSKMSMGDFAKITRTAPNPAITDTLSPIEKKLVAHFHRVEITTKRGNIVPVLITSENKSMLDVLVQTRSKVVPEGNSYLFPRIHYGSLGHLSGCECIREFATECGAKEPDRLRSTALRKHIATMSQVLNLKDHEMDVLARFMGHDIRVHREYYRLPEETIQMAKVSKLLLRMESGGEGLTVGETLDSITLPEDEEAEEVENEESESEPEHGEMEAGPSTSGETEVVKAQNQKRELHADRIQHDTIQTDSMKKSSKKSPTRKDWEENEKAAVLKHLGKFIALGKCPGKKAIDICKAAEPVLKSRHWKLIKYFCKNRISSRK